MRSAIFNANVAKINAHNIQGASWTMAINEFADLTSQEFAIGRIGGYKPRNLRRSGSSPVKSNLPSSVDWTTKGAVTPVKNQGQCGSCWSFSTTGSVEGAEKIFKDKLVSLSEQMLVDCSTAYGNDGCQGGLMDLAFEWIIKSRAGNIDTEASYPYASGSGVAPACRLTGRTVGAKIKAYRDIAHNENSIADEVYSTGPISIAVDATSWQTYSGGILTNCISQQVDHGVLAVGFDDDHSPKYWIIKNSWGPSWGEEGYIRVAKGSDQCLITYAPSTSESA